MSSHWKSMLRPVADGHWHGRITMALILPSAGLTAVVGGFLGLNIVVCGLLGGLGCFLGLFLSPDLDQEMATYSEWLIQDIPLLGTPLMALFTAFWMPYALLMPHRGISHMPILGTVTRVVYMAVPAVLLAHWFGLHWEINWLLLGMVFTGLCLSDIGHAGRDVLGWQI